MPRFLFALYHDPSAYQAFAPDELQAIVEQYVAWRQGLEARGHLVASDKLQDGTGRVLRRDGGRLRVVDGPYSEAKELLGGFFVVRAESYEQAVELARDCPHLGYSGTIEIREIDEL